MGKKNRHFNKGFTIIELMLVLAIAGIILVTVLLAVSQLQRNTRNDQRKDDVTRLLTRINDARKYNNGNFNSSCNNTEATCIVRDINMMHYDNKSDTAVYITYENATTIGAFKDGVDPQHDPTGETGLNSLKIRTYAKCDGNQMTGNGALQQNIAIQYALEQGNSSNSLFCQYL